MAEPGGQTVAYLPFEEAFQELLPELLPALEASGFSPRRIDDPNYWTEQVDDAAALVAVFGTSNPEKNMARDPSSEWWPAMVEEAFVEVAFRNAGEHGIPIIVVLISDELFSLKEVRKRLGGPMRDVSWAGRRAAAETGARVIRADVEEELGEIPSRVLDALAGGAETGPTGRVESITGASLSDCVTARDTLGFTVYYEAMAEFLANPGTRGPLTISIEGEWGSGKSSFMEMLRLKLEKKHKTVTFNAWRHDREDAMWAAFALKFVEDLSAKATRFERLKAAWTLMRRRFDWRSGWSDFARTVLFSVLWIAGAITIWLWGAEIVADLGTPEEGLGDLPSVLWILLGIGGTAGAARSLFLAARDASEIVGNPLRFDLRKHVKSEDYASRIGFIERFHSDFAKIVDAYAGREKVYVFIDDLDRCEVPRAADLMQAINLMTDVDADVDAHLIFIIGMDRRKVAAGLAVKFRDILPYVDPDSSAGGDQKARAGTQFGYEFIEKFVQIPFRVPVPDEESLNRFLREIARKPGSSPQADGRTAGLVRGILSRFRRTRSAPSADGLPSGGSDVGADAVVESSETVVQRQWDVLALQVREDSDVVRDVVKVVARALDYNPRRLKQFINLFRLRAYMAYNTGLLHPEVDAERSTALTLEQLGKFVAVGLRWPIFMMDLEADRTLLRRLSQYAEAAEHGTTYEPDEGERETEVEKAWRWNRILMRLLAAKADPRVTPEDAEQYRTYEDHTMTRLAVARLLRVAPPAAPPARDAGPNQRTGPETSDPDSSGPQKIVYESTVKSSSSTAQREVM